ncbi:MAG: GntR family transcriptional regulator [Chloroflexi bacterium]|nr:GntR family transcriptional regulator [Chloroflexota bacterium]
MPRANSQQRQSLRNETFDNLHKRVIAGEVQPGEWLRQEDIASSLGVSMTPVREALDMLVASGLAERIPYRGVRVIELSHEEMLDAYGLRFLLEPLGAARASEAASPREVKELKRLFVGMSKLVRLEDMSRLRELSRQFHVQVMTMSGSPLLTRLYEIVSAKFPDWMLYEAMFRHPEALTESLRVEQEQHRAMVNAIVAREAQAAAQAAREHILSLGKDLEIYLGISHERIQQVEKQVLIK